MKKTIRAILCILAVSLTALSCNKTTLNSIAISGTWEHIKTVTSENGQVVETWYPATSGMSIVYEFDNDGKLLLTEASATGVDVKSGSWLVDGNNLILTFTRGSQMFHIDKAGLLELILSETYTQNGHNYVDVITLKHLNE